MTGDNARRVRVSLTEDHAVGEGVRGSLQTYIAGLTVPQKVELAAKGNREVRSILSRDPSSSVARAVVNSPRLTDVDVVAYAGSPLTNEEVLRAIAERPEWSKNTWVKAQLVANPRTPPAVALRMIGHLPLSELSLLARNRSVTAIVRQEAKKRVNLARR